MRRFLLTQRLVKCGILDAHRCNRSQLRDNRFVFLIEISSHFIGDLDEAEISSAVPFQRYRKKSADTATALSLSVAQPKRLILQLILRQAYRPILPTGLQVDFQNVQGKLDPSTIGNVLKTQRLGFLLWPTVNAAHVV